MDECHVRPDRRHGGKPFAGERTVDELDVRVDLGEFGAAIANLPAITDRPALCERGSELMLGLACDNVLGQKEARKVLSHDFVGLIAENAFGPGVPTEQVAVESDEEDGVLLGIRGQQVESLSHFLRRETV